MHCYMFTSHVYFWLFVFCVSVLFLSKGSKPRVHLFGRCQMKRKQNNKCCHQQTIEEWRVFEFDFQLHSELNWSRLICHWSMVNCNVQFPWHTCTCHPAFSPALPFAKGSAILMIGTSWNFSVNGTRNGAPWGILHRSIHRVEYLCGFYALYLYIRTTFSRQDHISSIPRKNGNWSSR